MSSEQTKPLHPVWVETLFKGYYWKSEARKTKRRMKKKRKTKKGNPPPSRAWPSLRELGQAALSTARPELGCFRRSGSIIHPFQFHSRIFLLRSRVFED